MPSTATNREFKSFLEEEIIPRDILEDSIIPWIGDNLDPDDVFSEKKLEAWAESNGYVKE